MRVYIVGWMSTYAAYDTGGTLNKMIYPRNRYLLGYPINHKNYLSGIDLGPLCTILFQYAQTFGTER